MNPEPVNAPFPYFGGKRRAAPEIWRRFGPVTSYIEPFGGSLAVLLACPYGPRPREIANDLDGAVVNFFRACRSHPEVTAWYADWPTTHLDLTARKRFVLERLEGLTERLRDDPEYCDPQVAGYWVWCVCNDIGHFGDKYVNKMPAVDGGGLSAQAGGMPCMADGQGLNAQARTLDGMPTVHHQAGGEGLSAQATRLEGLEELEPTTPYPPCSGQRPLRWLKQLQARLFRTYLLCKDWRGIYSPSVLGQAPKVMESQKPPLTGIFFDPPYGTQGRHSVYRNDSLTLAEEVREVALRIASPTVRVALAAYQEDYPEGMPEGWDCYVWRTAQNRKNLVDSEYSRTEVVWFSPSCIPPEPNPQANFLNLLEE